MAPDQVESEWRSRARRAPRNLPGVSFETLVGLDSHFCPDHPGLEARVRSLHRLDRPHIAFEGRGRGVKYDEIIVARLFHHRVDTDLVGRGIDELRPFDEGRRLGEPGR